ncbi:MAG: prolyl oligopeptidase family serine peptidase [Chloroflexi bacterium]|nr:prolyl oligopeptidase family serine peptidase [Chloroflexota bacterium]
MEERIELDADGSKLPAAVYRPAGQGPWPGVVVGPGGMARGAIEQFVWLSSRLADAGFLALTATYRADAPIDDPADFGLAFDWLARSGLVDSSRIALVGHSRGAMSALRTAALDARFRAVVAIGAPFDLHQNAASVAQYSALRFQQLLNFMGDPKTNEDRYRLVQATTYADRIKQPTLIVHGHLDMMAPVDQVEPFRQQLLAAGNKQVRVEIIQGMGHFFERTTNGYLFDPVVAIITSWLREVL